jgi:hypothetical protein
MKYLQHVEVRPSERREIWRRTAPQARRRKARQHAEMPCR